MAGSRSGSGKPLYVLRESVLRDAFAKPVGIVVTERADLARAVEGCSFVASVGDVVTLDLLESGITPDLSIVDYATKRMPIAEVRARFAAHPQEEVRISNPPGTITRALWDAIADSFRDPRHIRIVVDGEEDLASLACISLAPEGACVVYGIPGKGAAVNKVDAALRKLVDEALDGMRV